jgi:hypothetical protein
VFEQLPRRDAASQLVEEAILALLSSPSIEAAAAQRGVNEKTLRR